MDKLYIDHYNSGKLTQEDIALATGLTILSIRQALYKAGCKLSNAITPEWCDEAHIMPPAGTIEEQARQYIVDPATYRRIKYEVRTTKETTDRTDLKQAIAAGNKTQAELAKEFQVSQATVSRHNPKRQKRTKPYGPRINPTTWRKIKEFLATNDNISEAARHFKVARQTIYRKLNDDN